MKFCTHCGSQLDDNAVICPHCGCPTELYNGGNFNRNGNINRNQPKPRVYSPLSIIGFVCAFLFPLAGLICSVLSYNNAKVENNIQCKQFSKAGIIISAVLLGLQVIYYGIAIVFAAINGYGNWYMWDFIY